MNKRVKHDVGRVIAERAKDFAIALVDAFSKATPSELAELAKKGVGASSRTPAQRTYKKPSRYSRPRRHTETFVAAFTRMQRVGKYGKGRKRVTVKAHWKGDPNKPPSLLTIQRRAKQKPRR